MIWMTAIWGFGPNTNTNTNFLILIFARWVSIFLLAMAILFYKYKDKTKTNTNANTNTNDLILVFVRWVSIFLLAMAILFYVPRMIWLTMEGGLMAFLCTGCHGDFNHNPINRIPPILLLLLRHAKGTPPLTAWAPKGLQLEGSPRLPVLSY